MNANKPRFVAIDIETTSLTWDTEILTVAAAWRGADGLPTTKAWVLSHALCDGMVIDPDTNEMTLVYPDSILDVSAELRDLMDMADMVVFHNGAFDIPFLVRDGLLHESSIRRKVFDTMLAARMTGAHESHSLNALLDEFGIGPSDAEERAFYDRMKGLRGSLLKYAKGKYKERVVPTDDILRYNALDVAYTLELAEVLWQFSIKPTRFKDCYSLEQIIDAHDFVRVASMMRVRGQKVDMEALIQARSDFNADLRDSRQLMYDLSDGLIESEAHNAGLSQFFSGRRWFHAHSQETSNGNYSFDKTAVAYYLSAAEDAGDTDAWKILNAVQDTRHTHRIATRIDELIESADPLDRVHGGFKVGTTVTYRMASSNPNVQNLPRDLKIWAPYLGADYSQAELRLAAIIAKVPTLQGWYGNGADVHQMTADRMFAGIELREGVGKRHVAKQVNFLSLYGGGADKLRQRLAQDQCHISRSEAQEYKSAHKKTYPEVYRAMALASEIWENRGYVKLWDGTRVYYQALDAQHERGYKAFNNIIQGGIARMVEVAMRQLHDAGVPLIGQVHDEIRFDPVVEDDESIVSMIREIMEGALPKHIRETATPTMEMKVDIEYKGNRQEKQHA